MEKKTKYPFAEVEARWRKGLTESDTTSSSGLRELASEPAAASSDVAGVTGWARHYLFTWPASTAASGGGDVGRGDASLARRWILADTLARFLRHRGLTPFFPPSVDSFAPEIASDAQASGASPRHAADAHRERVKALARALGTGFTEPFVDTAEPSYYRFSQWIFLQLFLRGLAARTQTRRDFCSRCGGHYRFGAMPACPECQGELLPRDVFEWQVDITSYGDRLLGDLDRSGLDDGDRAAQCDLLGRCRGFDVTFPVSRMFSDEYTELTAFTTTVERIFGVTFLLVDPYHPILEHILDPAYEDDVVRYRERLKKGAEPRISAARTGGFALNPANLRRIPILVSPLARAPFSDGVVMGVPAHDADLFELARRLKLGIREVIHNDKAKFDSQSRLEEPWLGDGVLTNSGAFTSMASKVGRERIVSLLSKKGVCRKATCFRLSSLSLASESSCGPPVPIVHCKRCGAVPVPEAQLPVELPPALPEAPRLSETPRLSEAQRLSETQRRGTAEPSTRAPGDAATREPVAEGGLGALKSFVRTDCPVCGESALRDTHTLLPWLGSAWSFLRLALPELSGAVDGFRDPNAPGGSKPAAAAAEPGSSAVLGRDTVPHEPERGAVAGESATPRDDDTSDSTDSEDVLLEDVLPEDVDIFGVPGSSREGSDGASSTEDADIGRDRAPDSEPVAASDDSVEDEPTDEMVSRAKASDVTGAEEKGPSSEDDRAAASAESDSERPSGDAAEETPLTRKVSGKLPSAPREEEQSSEKDEEESEEESELDDEVEAAAAALARLSKLHPFQSAAIEALFPVGSAFGAGHLGPKDLIGTRFLAKFLSDAGQIPFSEPFARYRRVAPIRFAEPLKVTRPGAQPRPEPTGCLDVLERCGADALRLHLLFTAPPGHDAVLDPRGVYRMQRFLDRVWRQVDLRREKGKFVSRRMLVNKHFLIHDVTRRLSEWKFHTAVAALMSFVRFLEHPETAPEDMDRGAMRTFVILLSPFSPFLAQELWSRMGETQNLEAAQWPVASDELIHPPEREYLIYVDGKVRDRMQQPSVLEPEKLESRALGRERIREIVGSRKVERVVVVPQKLVSIVLAQ